MEYTLKKRKISECPKCNNEIMFELSNGKDNYAVSIEAILTCLQIAEAQGAIPDISGEWWSKIYNRYSGVDSSFELDKKLKEGKK